VLLITIKHICRSSVLSGRVVRMLPPGESRWVCRRDRQTDKRTDARPLPYIMLSALDAANLRIVSVSLLVTKQQRQWCRVRETQNSNFDEHKRAFRSVEFVRLPVKRPKMLVAEYRTRLRADVLRTAPSATQTFAVSHSTRPFTSSMLQFRKLVLFLFILFYIIVCYLSMWIKLFKTYTKVN